MQRLKKSIVISENAPENTNVIWAHGDVSDNRKIVLYDLRQYIDGEWVPVKGGSEPA